MRIGILLPARALAALAASMLLSACQVARFADREFSDLELLAGTVVFGEPVSSSERPDVDILATSDAMRAFAAEAARPPRPVDRFRALLARMRQGGYVLNNYEPYLNLPAPQTFLEKRGNCLSYTSLFVALARAVGLDASFQIVDVPPEYDSVNGMLVLNKHVNVFVGDVPGRRGATVEFSEEYKSGIYDREVVDDDYATALYYNNIAFSHALTDDPRGSFVYLRKAIEAMPSNPDYWANLGVFYARGGHLDHAVAAHGRALALDADHGAAIRGLANAYAALGRDAASVHYRKRVAHSRARDAYTYFTLAQRALDANRPVDSLELLSSAIRLHRKDHRFYRLQGQAHDELGNDRAAEASFARARAVARNSDRPARRRSAVDHYPPTRIVFPSGRSTGIF